MKCAVFGCDTDETVVSYTSVFFVKFPSEALIQDQWLTMLGIVDSELIQALIAGEAKLCSSHFSEQCFGQHPVYGYRYLFPDALPTILPLAEYEDLLQESDILPQDAASNFYFMYVGDGAESAAIGEQPVVDEAEVDSFDDFPIDPSAITSDGDDEDGLEEIGIEYADGKYYFLRLDKEPANEADEPSPNAFKQGQADTSSNVELVSNKEGSIQEEFDTLINETQEEEPCNVEPVGDITPAGNAQDADLVEDIIEIDQDSDPETTDSTIDELDVNDIVWEQVDESNGSGTEEEDEIIAETVAEPKLEQSEELSDNGTEYIDNASEPPETGSIEALDEVSVCDGNIRVRDINLINDRVSLINDRVDRHFCNFCKKGFPYPSNLKKHMLVHTKLKPHTCHLCGRSFAQKINLTVHMRVHTGVRPNHRFTCKVCGKKSYRKSEFNAHLEVHRRKYPLQCPACDTRFVDVTTLYIHLRRDHHKEMSMQLCLEMLAETPLVEIVTDQHEMKQDIVREDGRWECSVCRKAFFQKSRLQRHKRQMHPKIFPCRYCPRNFPYKSMLVKHLPVHTREKPFRCTHCSASFTQPGNRNKHILSRHPETVQRDTTEMPVLLESGAAGQPKTHYCTQCDKQFHRRATWVAHLDSHHNTDFSENTCEQCNVTFASKGSLRNHQQRKHNLQLQEGKNVMLGAKLRVVYNKNYQYYTDRLEENDDGGIVSDENFSTED